MDRLLNLNGAIKKMFSVMQEATKPKTDSLKKKVYMTFRNDYINSKFVGSFSDWLLITHNIDYLAL
jgi:hypothetical protein